MNKEIDINEVAISVDVDSEVIEGVRNGEIGTIVLEVHSYSCGLMMKQDDIHPRFLIFVESV